MIEIKNNAEVAELYIYGDIVSNSSEKWFDEVCPEDVIEELNGLGNKPLNIRISSYGGSVFGGISLFNILKSYKGYKTAIIDSCACSIASVIAMSADKIKMYDSSYLMIHRAWVGGACGNAEDLEKQVELLKQLDNTILDIYKTKLKADYPVEDLVDLINAESWLTAKECMEIFDDIELAEDEVLAFAKVDKQDFLNHLSNYKNIPESLKAQLEEEAKAEDEEVVEDGCKKKPDDKCEKDDKKCLAMKCPECDYEGEFDVDEEGNYVCPKCGFKLEPDTDDDMEVEDGCKTDDEKDACKKKEKAQAEAKKQLDFLKAKMFLDNYK